MNLLALRSLVRDYVNDVRVGGDMYGDPELDRAVNESQRSLGAAMQKLEPAILSEHTTLVTSSDQPTSPSYIGTMDEYLLPADFRKLVSFVRVSEVSGGSLADPILVDVLPFHTLAWHTTYDSYPLDVAYVRDYMIDEFEGDVQWSRSNNRLFELDGELFSGAKDRVRQSVIGFTQFNWFQATEGSTAPVSVQYEVHYHAKPDTLVNDADECQLPPEHHELIAVDAAVHVLGHDNSIRTGITVLHRHLLETMAATLPGVGGELAEVA